MPEETAKPKIYCKNCKYYLGRLDFKTDYPMGPSYRWDYVCGLHKESVFRINPLNDCKDFSPKEKSGWRKLINKLLGK